MLPNCEGRFKAAILEHGVSETGPNHLATFICRFQLIQELGNGQWRPVDEDLDITGYFYLEKRDGSINTSVIDSLKSAFGWDGRDPLWLQDTDFVGSGLIVQVKLAFEQYQGKTRLKVQYVDAENSTGGPGNVPRADDSTRRSLANRLGAKLRANAAPGTGTPVRTPTPAGKPSPPNATARATARQASQPNPQQATTTAATANGASSGSPAVDADTAWAAFKAYFDKPDVDPTLIESEWFRILGEMFPGRDADGLAPHEWAAFIAEAPKQIIPF
jgi:hypothetical protein